MATQIMSAAFAAVLRDFQRANKGSRSEAVGAVPPVHLLVAHLLDDRGMTAEALMSKGMRAAPIEAELEK